MSQHENAHSIAALIDHTLLRADATQEDIRQLCREAQHHGFASVCVNPFWVARVAEHLEGSEVQPCSVIAFPLGAVPAKAKVSQALMMLKDGARELDMVMNIGALRSGLTELVSEEIRDVAAAAHENQALLKVILEMCLLEESEKLLACELAMEAGCDFVKTSTGFSTGGATIEDVALMRRSVPAHVRVKASGGIRDLEALRAMVSAGAARIGTSSGVSIMEEVAEAGKDSENKRGAISTDAGSDLASATGDY